MAVHTLQFIPEISSTAVSGPSTARHPSSVTTFTSKRFLTPTVVSSYPGLRQHPTTVSGPSIARHPSALIRLEISLPPVPRLRPRPSQRSSSRTAVFSPATARRSLTTTTKLCARFVTKRRSYHRHGDPLYCFPSFKPTRCLSNSQVPFSFTSPSSRPSLQWRKPAKLCARFVTHLFACPDQPQLAFAHLEVEIKSLPHLWTPRPRDLGVEIKSLPHLWRN